MTTVTEAHVPAVQPQPGKPVYTRVAVTGLVLTALAPVTMVVLGTVAGMDMAGEIVFLLLATAIPLIGAALVWRFGTWAKIVGALASVLAGLAMFWVAFGLAYPASFGDFVPGTMLPLGVLMGLAGSIAAIVQKRRGHMVAEATRLERRIIMGALAIVVLAAAVSGVLDLTGNRAVASTAGAVDVTMADFAFAEGNYEVSAGQTQFVVRNDDPFAHDFTIPELDVAVDVLPGSQQLVELSAEPGTYQIYCTLHSDTSAETPSPDDMAATLTVN